MSKNSLTPIENPMNALQILAHSSFLQDEIEKFPQTCFLHSGTIIFAYHNNLPDGTEICFTLVIFMIAP
jgi:hypothetical protein